MGLEELDMDGIEFIGMLQRSIAINHDAKMEVGVPENEKPKGPKIQKKHENIGPYMAQRINPRKCRIKKRMGANVSLNVLGGHFDIWPHYL